ncbi:MAG: beta-galactosidase [Armatimonadota bacterium]
MSSISRFSRGAIVALLAGIMLICANSARAWDVGANYSTMANPNGGWSYGWADDATLTFTVFNMHESLFGSGSESAGWHPSPAGRWDTYGNVSKNLGPYPINQWESYREVGQVCIGPPWGDYARRSGIRWTCPIAGTYRVCARFTAQGYPSGSTALIYVHKNGVIMDSGQLNGFIGKAVNNYTDSFGTRPQIVYDHTWTLAQGDTIDLFARGSAAGSTGNQVGVDAQIVLVTDMTVVNPTPYALTNYPVTTSLGKLGNLSTFSLTGMSVLDKATGTVLPFQVDDLDNSGTPTAADELVCLVNMLPFSSKTIAVTAGQGTTGFPGFSFQDTGTSYTLTTGKYSIGGDNNGGFYFSLPPISGHFIDLLPWSGETKTYRSGGPIRVVLMSETTLADNGRQTRRIDAYPDFMRMTNTLSSYNGTDDVVIQGAGAAGFYFNMPQMGSVTGTSYKTNDGFQTDLVSTPPAQNPYFFGCPGGTQALDFITAQKNLMFIRTASVDYMGGMGLVGPHYYMAGGLVGGWRPPITIPKNQPLVQQVYLAPHDGALDECKALDRVYRDGMTVVYGTSDVQTLVGGNSSYLNRLCAALDTLQAQTSRAALEPARAAAENALSLANSGSVTESIAAYLTSRSSYEQVDIPASIDSIKSDIDSRILETKGSAYSGFNISPALIDLNQAQTYLTSAKWDYTLNRYDRALSRIESAAAAYAQSTAYMANPAPRLVSVDGITPGQVTPYVTFSQGVDIKMKQVGFDVAHLWFGYGSDQPWQNMFAIEPAEGVFNWRYADEDMNKVRDYGMKVVPLVQCEVPTWFKNKYNPPDGYEALVDPDLLGYTPGHMGAWGDFMQVISQRYGNRSDIVAWGEINEPAYYARGGATNSFLDAAIKTYLTRFYGTISALNVVWGTSYPSFDAVVLPTSGSSNPAAWYDVMLAKTKCFEGALKWQGDLLKSYSTCKRTGGKFVPICLDGCNAGAGWGVNPFVNNRGQQGVSMVDLYVDQEPEGILRVQELYDSNNECPVLSLESGPYNAVAGETFKRLYYPDQRAQSWAWTMFQHGLYGCHYWIWGSGEEYAVLDWDDAICDFGVNASLMNQKYRIYGDLLSTLKPVRVIGLYYPYANFVQGTDADKSGYASVYQALVDAGYQVKIFSASNFDEVIGQFNYVIVPSAPYIESAVVPKFQSFTQGGGKLVVTGTSGIYDEYRRYLRGNHTSIFLTTSGTTFVPTPTAASLTAALQGIGKKPETVLQQGSAYRQLMKDGRGNRYLLISSTASQTAQVTIYLPYATPNDAPLDLFTGQYCATAQDSGGTALTISLPAYGTAFIGIVNEASVGKAAMLPDGKDVALGGSGGVVVTAVFPDGIYVESSDRSRGIKVTGISAVEGDRLVVAGKLGTAANGERYVCATDWTVMGSGELLSPLGLNAKALRCGEINYDPITHSGQNGMPDGAGLSVVGLLVRVAGRVISTALDSFMMGDGTGHYDLKAQLPSDGSVVPPVQGAFAAVTGVLSTEWSGGQLLPVLRIRRPGDIQSGGEITGSWDVGADFAILSNPTGAWSYGYTGSQQGDNYSVTLYDRMVQNEGGAPIDKWRRSSDPSEPCVWHNNSGVPYNHGVLTTPAAGIGMHPGPHIWGTWGDVSIARWTAPYAGAFKVAATWSDLWNGGGATTDVHLRFNRASLFDGQVWQGAGCSTTKYMNCFKGDTIDFTTGVGSDGDYGCDTVGLDAKISLVE